MDVILKFLMNLDNLKNRISIFTILTITLSIGLFTFLQFEYMDDLYLYLEKKDMINVVGDLQNVSKEDELAHEKISSIETQYNVYLEIYDIDATLLYTTQNNGTIYGVSATEEETNLEDSNVEMMARVMNIISHTDYDEYSYFEVREEVYSTSNYLVYCAVLPDFEFIEVYYSLDVITTSADIASFALLLFTVFLVCGFLISNIAYVRVLIRPIWQISDATRKISDMDFSVNCPTYHLKDLNELSQNINVLAISLNRALHDLKSQNNKLEEEIETERIVDKTRRSFIANASHELKTPIAIIQGYAEGIKFGIGHDNTIEYCDTILDESKKMNNLVVRLLELSRYDSDGYLIKRKVFNIHELILDFLSPRIKFMQEENINFKYTISNKFFGNADPDLVRDIVNNYVSNACSHICNEKDLVISCKDCGNAYRVSVFNSGKPIAANDIDNIWNSFYRADKAHSRNEGRFGLGLSIVSSVQDLHKQKFGVLNHEDGVEFWFDIEKADEIDMFIDANSVDEINNK